MDRGRMGADREGHKVPLEVCVHESTLLKLELAALAGGERVFVCFCEVHTVCLERASV